MSYIDGNRFYCPECDRGFGTWEEMVDHINRAHPPGPTPPPPPPPPPTYECPECGAEFPSRAQLQDHIARRHPPPGDDEEPPDRNERPALSGLVLLLILFLLFGGK